MPNDKKQSGTLAQVLQLSGSRNRVPVLQIIRQKPIAALISKAVDSTIQTRHTANGSRIIDTPSYNSLQQVSNQTANNISQADTTLQMIPDTELGAQILISAVISPKDMMTLELTYKPAPGLMPPAVASSLTSAIRQQFDDVYKIKNKLPRILREVLFEKGSHVVAVIPENSIDEMINRNNSISLETYQDVLQKENSHYEGTRYGLATAIGLLGPANSEAAVATASKRRDLSDQIFNASLENFSLDAYTLQRNSYNQCMSLNMAKPDESKSLYVGVESVVITDNPNILRGPEIERKLRADAAKSRLAFNRLSVGLEAHTNKLKLDDRSLKAAIYKGRKRGVAPMQVMKTDNQLERKTIGRPLVMELPPESVIPVFTPGQEDKHVGYFILLDQTGNPVRASKEVDALGSMTRRLNSATNQQTNLINRLQQLTEGFGCANDQEHSEMMVRVYADMVEADLLSRLRNGIYTNSVALAKNPDYYRVMLTRVLQQQRTTVLFMPVEMVTYFARKYNKWGVGVSILDDMKVLNNMRALTTLANTMLGIKNSIPRTRVDLTVDETDPDPYKTAEMFIGEMMRVNQTAVPLGASTPVDMLDYFQKAQYQFNIKGHPGIPDTSAEFTEMNTGYQKVDADLEKSLQDRAMMTMGLNSDTVNNGFNQETATSVVANNLMLSRRVAILQEQMNPHITEYHKKVIRADEEILEELREILRNNYNELDVDEAALRQELNLEQTVELRDIVVDHLLTEFIDTLEVILPKPETATMENQKQALQGFIELLDLAIDAYISDEFFTDEIGGELNRSVDSIKKMFRAHFIRKYLAENGIMPELSSIVSNDDNNETIDLWETQKDHIEKLTKALGGFMRKIHEVKKGENQSMQNLQNDLEASGADSAGSGDVSTSSTDEAIDFNAGADDLGFDTDAGMEEPEVTPVDENTLDQPTAADDLADAPN